MKPDFYCRNNDLMTMSSLRFTKQLDIFHQFLKSMIFKSNVFFKKIAKFTYVVSKLCKFFEDFSKKNVLLLKHIDFKS